MPAQGNNANTALARWLNEVGMTRRELMRRVGYLSDKGFNQFVKGQVIPPVMLLYEIERVTEGGVPIEAWLSGKKAREYLTSLRKKQPEEYRPKKQEPEVASARPEREEES